MVEEEEGGKRRRRRRRRKRSRRRRRRRGRRGSSSGHRLETAGNGSVHRARHSLTVGGSTHGQHTSGRANLLAIFNGQKWTLNGDKGMKEWF